MRLLPRALTSDEKARGVRGKGREIPEHVAPPRQVRVRNMALLRPMPAASARRCYGTLAINAAVVRSRFRKSDSLSGMRFARNSGEYVSWTLRFHQIAGHGVAAYHGPFRSRIGPSSRMAEPSLYIWIQ